jgi:L-asparaginase
MHHPIRILCAGGTFEKKYNEIPQTLVFEESHLPEILSVGRSMLPVEIEMIFLMDSLDMTDEHHLKICERVKAAPEKHIVVTHGTDRMVKTATFLEGQVQDKTVVFTGSMIPYEFRNSDAEFNMGCALAFVQALPPGIYVTMNGRVWPHNKVRKNLETGIFEGLE